MWTTGCVKSWYHDALWEGDKPSLWQQYSLMRVTSFSRIVCPDVANIVDCPDFNLIEYLRDVIDRLFLEAPPQNELKPVSAVS